MAETRTKIVDDLMTMGQLARAVKMNRERLRKFCIDTQIAVRWGGTAKHPHLRAKLADVEKAIMARRYVPAGTPRPQSRRPPTALHPLVNC